MTETVTPKAPTIPALFTQAVAAWGDRVAARMPDGAGGWTATTWDEYAEAVRAVAGGLVARGLEPGDFGALIATNRLEWHVADLGMIHAGVISCPIYPTNSPSQVQYILEHSGAKVVFVEDAAQLSKVTAVRKECPELRFAVLMDGSAGDGEFAISWDDLVAEGRSADPAELDRRRDLAQTDDLLGVIYTSGTTGPPKGTMLSHANAVWTLASLDGVLSAGPEDRKLSFLPLSHVGERCSTLYLQLHQGFEVWFNRSTEALGEDLKAARPTVQFVVPRVLEKQYTGVMALLESLPAEQREGALKALEAGKRRTALRQAHQEVPAELEAGWQEANVGLFALARGALGYSETKALVSGAAPIAVELLDFFNAIGVPTFEVYGQTEGHGPTTINRLDNFKLGSVGYAIPGVELRIAEDGEILFRGGNVCMGYYRNPEATAELIDAEGWLHTGDVGVVDDEGFLTITDRKKDIIITAAGKNIAPQVIEQKLKFSPWVSQAVVIGDRRRYVTALLTLDEPAVRQFAEQKSIAFDSYAELTQHPDILGLIEAHVAAVNAELANAEQVKAFKVLQEDFSVEGGTITPTLKIKRKPIAERYATEVAALYGEG